MGDATATCPLPMPNITGHHKWCRTAFDHRKHTGVASVMKWLQAHMSLNAWNRQRA